MKSIIKVTGSRTSPVSLHASHSCSACLGAAKSVKREFSDQAWAALVLWREVGKEAVDQPVCNDCYFNFREVLIDRAEEVVLVASSESNQNQSRSRKVSLQQVQAFA